MTSKERQILRVPATLEEIKRSYARISKLYPIFEGRFEKGLRKRGLQLLAVQKGEQVLEVGFGTGYALVEIAKSVGETGKAYGIDLTPEMVELATERLKKATLLNRVELHQGDARNMPYEANMFHAAYMAETLELFDTPDIPIVLQEIKRVLKPVGRLGVVSLSKEGRENSRFLRFYEWVHQRIPKYASCRPIYVEQSIKEAGYEIVKREELLLWRLAPIKIVVAKPVQATSIS
jgi:demethylmenaquinone methyltransferase/2-methoxy-6-polyprenyl-1,4-benzoquinol methylase